MRVSDIIEFIALGELSTLNFIEDLESSDIAKKKVAIKKLSNYIYLGVLDLYSKFHFKTTIVTVKTFADVAIYQPRISSNIALMDVYDCLGEPLKFPEHEGDDTWDIKQIDSNTFLVQEPEDDKEIMFVFSAVPERVIDIDKEYDLPEVCLNALLFFVAMKGVSSFAPNMNQFSFEQTDVFRKRYEYEIHKLREIGVGNTGGRLARPIQEDMR